MTYAQPTCRRRRSRCPPSAGPSTCAVCCMIVLRLMAFGRSSRGTRLGTSDCRAGRSNAPDGRAQAPPGHTPATRAVDPLNASRASPIATIAEPVCVISISRRRSQASATTPLIIEKTMIGNDPDEADRAEREALLAGLDEQRHVPQQRRVLHERAGERQRAGRPRSGGSCGDGARSAPDGGAQAFYCIDTVAGPTLRVGLDARCSCCAFCLKSRSSAAQSGSIGAAITFCSSSRASRIAVHVEERLGEKVMRRGAVSERRSSDLRRCSSDFFLLPPNSPGT